MELRILFVARMFWRFCQWDSGSCLIVQLIPDGLCVLNYTITKTYQTSWNSILNTNFHRLWLLLYSLTVRMRPDGQICRPRQ